VLLVVQENELPRLLNLVAPGASCNHWQVYGDVPPMVAGKTADRADDCPESTGVGAAVTVMYFTVSADVLTISSEVDEGAVWLLLSTTVA
jgi:hypothetical protein